MMIKLKGYRVLEVERMKASFERGSLSRRDFMQGLLATGLSVTAAGTLIAGARDVHAETPKRGGRVRFAHNLHGPNDTLDPILFTTNLDYLRGAAYYNNLTRFNEDLSLSPELAEEWSSNADASEWTFKIRKGVQFHDGKPLDVDDVIYSLNRHLGSDSVSKGKAFVDMVTEWKKVDQYTMKAVLSSPNSDIAAILAVFQFKIIANGAEGDYFLKPNGTGPFKCQEFTPGVRSVGVRNDNYWVSGHPYIDELESFAITDEAARVNALVAGDIDLAAPIDAKAIKQINDSPDVEMYSIPSGAHSGIVCMLDRAPGNNPDFVMALKLLQRRERVLRNLLKGEGTTGNDQPISSQYNGYCAELPQREYDSDKAKFHLQKSGITKATIEVADLGPGLTDTCLLLQQEAQKVGLAIEVKRVPNDGYWGAVWMQKPIMVTNWNMRPTVNIMLSLVYKSDAPWNESRYQSERFDQLLVEARAQTDEARRNEMYCEMQTMIHNEAGIIIPAFRNYIDAKAKKIKGLQRVPLAVLGGQGWPEHVWIDA